MGAKFQGLTIFLIGIVALLSGKGIEDLSGAIVSVGGSSIHIYTPLGAFLVFIGIGLIIGGIAWAVLGSRYTVERRSQE